ncbi:hypothetical protein M2322_003949 [Rhodoblastus acidophilus]|nr:hypothetical protein [Rhodoblastus acidophilus]
MTAALAPDLPAGAHRGVVSGGILTLDNKMNSQSRPRAVDRIARATYNVTLEALAEPSEV